MKTTAAVAGFVLILLGLSGIGWMFPLFTLNEPYKTWYIERVLHVDAKPGGSGAALPFLWLVTAPVGLVLAVIGAAIFAWGKSR